jgi:hypothetical protein
VASSIGLFAKIESRDDALNTVREASNGFFGLAALQAAIGFFLFPAMITDAVILVILALGLRLWRSRIAAVLLLLMTGFGAVMTVLNKIGVTHQGGTNIFLAFIMLVVAVRAVEATFKLYGIYRDEPTPPRVAASGPIRIR